jgi:SAM-dependent methyltransferase
MVHRRLRRAYRRARRRLEPTVTLDGQRLPPGHLRYCGPDFQDDEVFLESGRQEARRLLEHFCLSPASRVLEIGCGPGRLPIGILATCGEIERYDGVDIDPDSVWWGARNITRHHPSFRFHLVDARHERYRPDGTPMDDSFRLPLGDADYDLVYLHSVFANLLEEDIRVYCREFSRVLKLGGRVFATAFVEDDVPPLTVNPTDYHVVSRGRLNLVRYERQHFLDLVCQPGLELEELRHGSELGGQSAVVLCRTRSGQSGTSPAR